MTNENIQELKEGTNKVQIEGILKEKKFFDGSNDKGDWVRAEFTVATSENEQHIIKAFSSATTKAGKPNGIYSRLQDVRKTYKAEADEGVAKEDADKVVMNSAQFSANDWVNEQDEIVENTEINSNFVNRVDGDFNPRATFENLVVVGNVFPEVNPEGDDTGRALLKTYAVGYGGRIIPLSFVVGKEGASYVLDNYEAGDTVKLEGEIINRVIENEKPIDAEAGFGGEMTEKTYSSVREYLVKVGSAPFPEDSLERYDEDAVKQALVERQTHLNGLIEKKKSQANKANAGTNTGAGAAAGFGFGGTPSTRGKAGQPF